MPGRIANGHGTGDAAATGGSAPCVRCRRPARPGRTRPCLAGEQAVSPGEIWICEISSRSWAAPRPDRYSALDEVNARTSHGLINHVDERLVDHEAPVGDLDRWRSASRREIVPHFRSAVCQVCGVPGTPTEMPLMRAPWNCNGSPVAGLMKAFSCMVAGAASRPSMVCTVLNTGVVEHQEAAAAKTGREWLGDAQRGRRRDSGVDGVAAVP